MPSLLSNRLCEFIAMWKLCRPHRIHCMCFTASFDCLPSCLRPGLRKHHKLCILSSFGPFHPFQEKICSGISVHLLHCTGSLDDGCSATLPSDSKKGKHKKNFITVSPRCFTLGGSSSSKIRLILIQSTWGIQLRILRSRLVL